MPYSTTSWWDQLGSTLRTLMLIGVVIALIYILIYARQHPEETKQFIERWRFKIKEFYYSLAKPGQSVPVEVPKKPVVIDQQGNEVLPPQRPYELIPQRPVGNMGVQVDAWGALVMNRGDLAKSNEALLGTLDALAKREVVNLALDVGGLVIGDQRTTRPHVFIYQKMPETSNEAVVVLRIAARGPDLEISWRLTENNPKRARNYQRWGDRLVLWGVVGMVISCPLLFVGVGEITLPLFFSMWGFGLFLRRVPQKQTLVSLYDQFDSRALSVTVHYCLMQALAALQVDKDDILLLREYDKQGLAKLGEFKLEWNPG